MAKRARIIVVGCSLFGCAVAQALSAAGHDVIVVDMQEDALDGLGPDFDGETLTGDGKSALMLEECGVRRATHLVAATDDDASNLLIAELAARSSACPTCCPSWTTTLWRTSSTTWASPPSAPIASARTSSSASPG